MRTFAQRTKATQPTSAKSTISGRGRFAQSPENRILHLQPTIGNHGVQRQLEGNPGDLRRDSTSASFARVGHDFSRIPVHASTPMAVQPGVTKRTPDGGYEQASDKEANYTEHIAHGPDSTAHDCVAPPLSSPLQAQGKPATKPSIEAPFPLFQTGFDFTMIPIHPTPSLTPRQGAEDDIDLDPPTDGAGPSPGSDAGPTAAAAGCDQPRSMGKVTSGSFSGGLAMGSYYPDLAGRGYPASAGPFDLGNRVGSSVQLVGVIPSPCEPSRFTIAQTYNVTRARFNGTVHPLEGQSGDDHARSGRNTSGPPFRQEFLGGGTAPLGYIISFADPPSIPYSATTATGEFDANFVSAVVGPGGRKSVAWSVSVRIAGGHVTTNTVT